MSKPILTTTEHKIGKVTYCIVSAASDKAMETIDSKVEKLIKKDMREAAMKWKPDMLQPSLQKTFPIWEETT